MQKNKYRVKASTPQQNNNQQEIVYFRLKKPIQQQQPEYQLIVNRHPRKVHHCNQQIQVNYDKKKEQKGQKEQKGYKGQKEQKINQLTNLFNEISLKQSAQFFLRRVDDIQLKYKNKGQQFVNKELLPKSKKLAEEVHKQIRQKLIAKSRGITIIDINQNCPKLIQIGNQKVQVQDLGSINQYYYVLKKRTTFKQGPTVNLPESSNHLFNTIQFQLPSDNQLIEQDDEDSNRSSNPDFDYPQQEYHQGDSQDEGVIDRDYFTYNSDYGDNDSQPPQLDEEQLYRRYLKRCKEQKNSSDDQYF